jgi:DNA repair protein RadC
METHDISVLSQLPRERLRRLGSAQLTDLELLTTLLGSGNARISAREAAGRLLAHHAGSLARLYQATPEQLAACPGIGTARASALLAGLELGRRLAVRPETGGEPVAAADHAFRILREYLPIPGPERIVALLLDSRNRVLDVTEASACRRPAGCELDLRHLIKTILDRNAAGLILAHTHPSGELSASAEDIRMTRDLESLLAGIGVSLLDHLILTAEGYCQVHWRPCRDLPA